MRTRWAGVAVLLALLGGCVQAPPPASVSDAHMDAIAQCLGEQTSALDDGMSDARTVSRSVVDACRGPISEAIQAGAAGQPYPYRMAFADQFFRNVNEFAAQVVLRVRADRRRPK